MEHVEATPIVPSTSTKNDKARRASVVGGSAVEALAGIGAVVLSIIGLAGTLVLPLAAIAVIAAGAALLFEAGAVTAEESSVPSVGDETERTAVRGTIGADAVAGLGAITLGVLSLIGLYPRTLLPVAAIVLGVGLLMSAAAPAVESEDLRHRVARDAYRAASGVHVLVGAAAVVLGIIGVLGNAPVLMTLICTLSIGAAQLLTGATLGARMANALRHGA